MSVKRYLIGMFLLALALLVPQPAGASDLKSLCAAREGDLPPWWVDVCGDPQPPVSPPLPPLTEDGADDPTPTLDDPTERGGSPLQTEGDNPTPSETPTDAPVEATPEPLPCPPGTTPAFGGLVCLSYWTPFGDWRDADWSIEPDLKGACVVEVIDQPVSVQDEDGSSAAYLGGCEIETCPDAEPVTTCCTGENWAGVATCQTVDPTSELYPYEPPATIWEALEWLLTLPGSGEVPAGWEGPWKFYLYTSASDGR